MDVCWRCKAPKVAGWSVPCAKCGALTCWKCGRAVEDRDQPYCGTCGTLLPGVAPAGSAGRGREPWVTPAQPWVAATPADPVTPAIRLTPAGPLALAAPEREAPGRLGFRAIVGSLTIVFVAAVAAFALWSAGRAEAPPDSDRFGPGAGPSLRGSGAAPVVGSPSPPTGGSSTAAGTGTASALPIGTASTGPTGTATDPAAVGPQSVAANPAAVVRAYFDAINRHDYQTAWDLGGRTFAKTYPSFAAGFHDTVSATVTIEAVRGNDVIVAIVARHTDGSTPRFAGIYTVRNGVLVGANVTRVGG